MTLKVSRSQVSTQLNPTHQKLKKVWPNPTQPMDGPNPWPTLLLQQEVWPPGSTDAVCPRPPVMTQVQHFVSRSVKKRQRWDVQTMWAYDLDLWPWRSPRLSVICSTCHRVPSCQFWWYYDYSFSIYGPLGQHGSDWSRDLTDLVTLIFNLGGHGACGWCGSSSSIRRPSLKFVGLAIRKIWRTMCVSINGLGDLDFWPFDLETGVLVTSEVGSLPSKFGHARPLG